MQNRELIKFKGDKSYQFQLNDLPGYSKKNIGKVDLQFDISDLEFS